MAITKKQKEDIVKQMTDNLKQATSIIISAFSRVSVNEDQALRSELREANVDYKVVKKTLLSMALKKADLDDVDLTDVEGNVAVAIAEDQVSAAKLIYKFAENKDNVSIIAGYLEGALINPEKVADLAKLPTKDELLAKTLATLNAPVQNFVGVLSGVTRSLVYALNAIKEQKS